MLNETIAKQTNGVHCVFFGSFKQHPHTGSVKLEGANSQHIGAVVRTVLASRPYYRGRKRENKNLAMKASAVQPQNSGCAIAGCQRLRPFVPRPTQELATTATTKMQLPSGIVSTGHTSGVKELLKATTQFIGDGRDLGTNK